MHGPPHSPGVAPKVEQVAQRQLADRLHRQRRQRTVGKELCKQAGKWVGTAGLTPQRRCWRMQLGSRNGQAWAAQWIPMKEQLGHPETRLGRPRLDHLSSGKEGRQAGQKGG